MNLRRLVMLAVFVAVMIFLGQWTSSQAQATPPTSPIIQLTNNHAIAVRPAWSPDNRMVAFQANLNSETFHIYIVNADGSNQRQLTKGATDDRHPAWMPDGKSILFDSEEKDEREEIWMVNVADESLKQITHLGAQANFPSPSSDGQRILFYLYQDQYLNLWNARIDGTDAKPLTRNLASADNNQCTFACHRAAWSADSQMVAYSGGEHGSIWTVRSDGSNAKEIIANEDRNHFPWFLADGRLGYITEHVNPVQAWTDAWAYDFKSGQATRVQEQMSLQGPFEWNKDNTKVLFHSPRSGNFEIYLIDLNSPAGIDALRGKPVPVTLAAGASQTSTAERIPAVNPATTNPAILVFAGALGAVVVVGVMGLILWRRSKH